jgi:dethiobiotin synthetase
MQRTIVITGTGTGVGKTVLTALLTLHLRAAGATVAPLKPICSGGRDDARFLRVASGGALTLDQINPWHFRAPLAPLLAARVEKQRVTLRDVSASIHQVALKFQFVLVEGAGGLLSPLGERFSTRELILALGAEMIVVAPNELGMVNQVRLTLEAMPRLLAARARVALIAPRKPDGATRTNQELLAEFIRTTRMALVPRAPRPSALAGAVRTPAMRAALDALLW